MPERNPEVLRIVDHRDPGEIRLSGKRLGPIRAERSALSVGKQQRSFFDNCQLSDVTIEKCVVGFPIFRKCVFKNVRADLIKCSGSLFLECTLQGSIRRVTFGICPEREPIDAQTKAKFASENQALLQSASYCLDVRDAILSDVGFDGQEIASRVLFSKGQCAVYRAQELSQRLDRVRETVRGLKDKAIHIALFGPLIFPGETLHLVSMESCGTTERISELETLLKREGIELIDQPLAGQFPETTS